MRQGSNVSQDPKKYYNNLPKDNEKICRRYDRN